MSGEVKLLKISPTTGTAITLGDSGDTFTVPSGATLTVASGATINITGATQTGFPAGGLTAASQWRVTADFAGDAQPIGGGTGTIAVVNSDGYGTLGSAMAQASGVFTFPASGFWLCLGQFTFTTTLNAEVGAYLEYTANNGGAWSTASWSEDGSNYGYRSNINIYHMMNITDTANQKVRWSVDADTAGSGGVVTTRGDSSVTETGFTFIKLA